MNHPIQPNPATRLPVRTEEEMQAMRQVRTDRRAALEATREYLDVGVSVIKDGPPGVGWVLERIGKANRYLGTKEVAIKHYWQLVSRGEG